MLGCAGIIALMFLPFGVLMAAMVAKATFPERIILALMPSGLAFIATLILAMRDRMRHVTRARILRSHLLNRHDVNESEFLTHFPNVDPELICQTRQAVAEYFDVPATKIHPSDDLRDDLQFENFEPDFHSFVLYRVLVARHLEPAPSQMFSFQTNGLVNLGDLANEVQRVLDGLKYTANDEGDRRIS